MILPNLSLLASVLNALLAVGAGTTQQVPSWKLGDSWHIAAEMRVKGEESPEKYDMHVVILGNELVGGRACVKVDFIVPKKPALGGITMRQRVFIDAKDGWPRKAFSFRDYRDMPLAHFASCRALVGAPEGYPLEMLPDCEGFEETSEKGEWKLTFRHDRDSGLRQTTLWRGEEKEIEVRQIWRNGESWWREYERFRKGKLDLRANVIEHPKVVTAKPETKKPVSSDTPRPKAVAPAFVDDSKDTLRGDPRLEKKLSWSARNPRVKDALELFQRTTGLDFTMEGVDEESPFVGTVTWGNVPTYIPMREIAESSPVQGRWEKTDSGYLLRGKHTKEVVLGGGLSLPILIGSLGALVLALVVTARVWRRSADAKLASPKP